MKGKRKTTTGTKVTRISKSAKTPALSRVLPAKDNYIPTSNMTVAPIPTAETLSVEAMPEPPHPTAAIAPDSKPPSPMLAETPSELDRKNNFLFVAGLVVFLAVVTGTGLIAVFLFTQKNQADAPVEEKTVVQPGPSPREELDRSLFVFEVLNGSGSAGAAAKATKQLEDLGYLVIKTGNAGNQNFTETEIYLKEDLTKLSEQLLDDLKSKFSAATFSAILEVSATSTASARLIVGKGQ